MRLKHRILFISCLLALTIQSNAKFKYKRDIIGDSTGWKSFFIPSDMMNKCTVDFADIRIIGINEKGDSIEAPYIIRFNETQLVTKNVDFKIVNKSKNEKGYYYTFVLDNKLEINSIQLKLAKENFDCKLLLEGSNNEKEWFTLLDDYRIVSIHNSHTNYSFTDLNFSNSNYKYYRLLIKSNQDLILNNASISIYENTEGESIIYKPSKLQQLNKKGKEKKSYIFIDFKNAVFANSLALKFSDTYDYFRPISIESLVDSVKTQNGYVYNYSLLYTGTLSSIDKQSFSFDNQMIKKLRISIENDNNPILHIKNAELSGSLYKLIVRFTEPADYAIYYGNKTCDAPYYDIVHFENNIPKDLATLTLSKEVSLLKKIAKKKKEATAFEDKTLIFSTLAVLVLIIGFLTFRMLRNDKNAEKQEEKKEK